MSTQLDAFDLSDFTNWIKFEVIATPHNTIGNFAIG